MQERRDYLLAQAAVLILALFFLYSLISQIANISSIAATSKQQLAKMTAFNNRNLAIRAIPSDNEINNWYLFGGSASAGDSSATYALLGIVFSKSNASEKKAIISTNTGVSELYTVGDKLPQGAIIKSIETDKVILINNGREQKLTLRWDPIINNTGEW